jgi:hypothetical protein
MLDGERRPDGARPSAASMSAIIYGKRKTYAQSEPFAVQRGGEKLTYRYTNEEDGKMLARAVR